MNGHNCYIIVNSIAYCMKHAINLFILFLHTLHFFQLFSINVFAPLKHVLIGKIKIVFKHDFGCFLHMD